MKIFCKDQHTSVTKSCKNKNKWCLTEFESHYYTKFYIHCKRNRAKTEPLKIPVFKGVAVTNIT